MAKDDQVAALFEQVEREQGRLDLLVNNAFSLPETLTDPEPFWEKPLSYWEMVDVGVRSNYVAAWHAAHIMVPQKSGLIVQTSGYVGVTYTYGVVFGTVQSRRRPDGARHGHRAEAAQRGLDVAVDGSHFHRAGRAQPGSAARDEGSDRHEPGRSARLPSFPGASSRPSPTIRTS